MRTIHPPIFKQNAVDRAKLVVDKLNAYGFDVPQEVTFYMPKQLLPFGSSLAEPEHVSALVRLGGELDGARLELRDGEEVKSIITGRFGASP